MKLYLSFERTLTETEADAMREFVKRRGLREPLQHIVGSTSFCGFEIGVNRNVLVPRPETELLAEAGWEWLGKRPAGMGEHPTTNIEHPTSNAGATMAEAERRSPTRLDSVNTPPHGGPETGVPTALDFGTGSGCIAIALATKCPGACVVALDVSAEALALARENAHRNGVNGRIEFRQGNGFAALRAEERFDLIISNPPYIPAGEIALLQPEVRDFDPHGALDGGADGLDFYRQLATEAAAFLKPEGKLMVEFGDGQATALKSLLEAQMWIVESVREDYSQRQRILIARRS